MTTQCKCGAHYVDDRENLQNYAGFFWDSDGELVECPDCEDDAG